MRNARWCCAAKRLAVEHSFMWVKPKCWLALAVASDAVQFSRSSSSSPSLHPLSPSPLGVFIQFYLLKELVGCVRARVYVKLECIKHFSLHSREPCTICVFTNDDFSTISNSMCWPRRLDTMYCAPRKLVQIFFSLFALLSFDREQCPSVKICRDRIRFWLGKAVHFNRELCVSEWAMSFAYDFMRFRQFTPVSQPMLTRYKSIVRAPKPQLVLFPWLAKCVATREQREPFYKYNTAQCVSNADEWERL